MFLWKNEVQKNQC